MTTSRFRPGKEHSITSTSASTSRTLTRKTVATAALLYACVLASAPALSQATTPAPAPPAHPTRLTAALSPERLGAATTIRIGFQVSTPAGKPPSPVTDVQLLLPPGLSIATSELGLETCVPAQLEHDGPSACPADSLMGRGSALTEVPFGSTFVTEPAKVTLFSAPLTEGHARLLFLASGELPVLTKLVFGSVVLPASAPFGALIDTTLPLVSSVGGGPDVALVRLQTTIGAKGIVYYERTKGKTISFRPRSLLLPAHCPRGGFRFSAHLTFQDATRSSAAATVPCP
jgi:hypothetical protein